MEDIVEEVEPTKEEIVAQKRLRLVEAAEVYMAGVYPDEYYQFVEGTDDFENFSPPLSLSLVDVCEMYAVSKTSL
jgi:hypothetical protein